MKAFLKKLSVWLKNCFADDVDYLGHKDLGQRIEHLEEDLSFEEDPLIRQKIKTELLTCEDALHQVDQRIEACDIRHEQVVAH